MSTCPQGTVWSNDSKAMSKAGYNIESRVYPTSVCLPKPCKWFFDEGGKSFYNEYNKFFQNGCSCDFRNGWISTITNQTCIPLFENIKSLKHSAASIQFVKEPQTLHQYVYTSSISPLSNHITNILENMNTKQASTNFVYKKDVKIEKIPRLNEKRILIAGEFGQNSFNISSKNAKKIMKAISMRGVLSDDYYDLGNLEHCSKESKNLFCTENHFLLFNESVAFEKAIGGIYWEFDDDVLKIFPINKSEYLQDIELEFVKHTK